MKKFVVVIIGALLLGFMTLSAAAQPSSGVLKITAGYINPKDAKAGLLIGAGLGTAIDESVDIGFGIDLYHQTYSQDSWVAKETQPGLTTNQEITLVEYSRTIVPLRLGVDVRLPATRYFGYLIRGDLSYQFLISKEKNFEEEINRTRNFKGLGWQGSGGFYYIVGSRSTFTLTGFYNSCEVSRSVEKSEKGLPVIERVDLSGLGFRLGVVIDIR